jgi:hypothetical protein
MPGLLVARRELFVNSVPDIPHGGTVAYVTPTEHGPTEPPMSLSDVSYDAGQMCYQSRRHQVPERRLQHYLDEANQLFSAARKRPPQPLEPPTTAEFKHLRCFPYPTW